MQLKYTLVKSIVVFPWVLFSFWLNGFSTDSIWRSFKRDCFLKTEPVNIRHPKKPRAVLQFCYPSFITRFTRHRIEQKPLPNESEQTNMQKSARFSSFIANIKDKF